MHYKMWVFFYITVFGIFLFLYYRTIVRCGMSLTAVYLIKEAYNSLKILEVYDSLSSLFFVIIVIALLVVFEILEDDPDSVENGPLGSSLRLQVSNKEGADPECEKSKSLRREQKHFI